MWQEEEKSAPPIGGLLSSEQREDLRELLVQFKKCLMKSLVKPQSQSTRSKQENTQPFVYHHTDSHRLKKM